MDVSTGCVDSPCNATTSALEPKEKDELHGPCNTEQNVVDASTACVESPCNVTTSDLELKQQEKSHGPANSEQNVVDASTACVDGPYNATTSALEPKEQEESHGSDNSEKNVVDTSASCVDGPSSGTTSALESNEQEKSHGPENVGIGHDYSKAPQAVGVVNSDTAATQTSELKKKGDDLGPYDAATSALELKEQETSHGGRIYGPNSNDIGCDTRDASVDVHVGDSSTTVALTLEVNEKGDYLGIDHGDIGHAIRDAPLAAGEVDSETASTTLEVKLKGERLGSVNTEQNMVGSSSAFVDSPCNATLSVFESKEQEESVGPDSGDTGPDTSGAPRAVFVVNSGTAAAPTLELNEKDLGSEPDNVIADPDFPSASVVLNYDAAEESVLAPKENQEACGPGGTEHKDARSAHVASSCNAEASTLESKEQEETHGTDDCNSDLCLEVSRSDSGEDSALALKVGNAAVIDNCDVQRDAVTSLPSVIERNDTTEASIVRNDTTEVLNTEPLNGRLCTIGDLTQTDAASTMELKVEKTNGRGDGDAENAHYDSEAEVVTGDDCTASHVLDSDTVAETTSETKVEKDGHDMSKSEPSS
ncbi:uncharacterized protein LOC141596873 [Silene latifolia]|uniref:uncharacterized protein LOC141596873 n=1 Tax=Silene latifolia TaxID=37657 RepID=UPI003D77BC5A